MNNIHDSTCNSTSFLQYSEYVILLTVCVVIVNPVVGRFPNHHPYPNGQVSSDQMHESESSNLTKLFDHNLKIQDNNLKNCESMNSKIN